MAFDSNIFKRIRQQDCQFHQFHIPNRRGEKVIVITISFLQLLLSVLVYRVVLLVWCNLSGLGIICTRDR